MKKLLPLVVLLGSLTFASAQTATIYSEDWGSGLTGGSDPTSLGQVGWFENGPPGGGAGMFVKNPPALDNTSGIVVSNNVVFFFDGPVSSLTGGMIYTTNAAGSGTLGDSAFTSIDPTLATNKGLTLNVETQIDHGTHATNFFAVLVGGQWYVSTNQFTGENVGPGAFGLCSLAYTNLASEWNVLDFNTVTIGGPAPANLTGTIDGIGIVMLWGPGDTANGADWNYGNLTITVPLAGAIAPKINGPGFSLTTFTGGGASFAVSTSAGTQPLKFFWQKDGVSIHDGPTGTGSTISGTTTNKITILNTGSADQTSGTGYSVIVSNSVGTDSSLNYTTNSLTVTNAPSDYLYAETFPDIGPLASGDTLTTIGWVAAVPDAPQRIFTAGNAFSFENFATTVAFYTSTTNDTGFAGLPFVPINPATNPAVSFRVDIAPTFAPANVTARFAVQMNSNQWFASTIPIFGVPSTANNAFATYGEQFDPTAAGWDKLTVNSTSATIGAQSSTNLGGIITGAGIVFSFTAGGTYLVDNFLLVTDTTPPAPPIITSLPNAPFPQTVNAGGGAQFAVSDAGTPPLTNGWTLNDIPLHDGPTGTGSIIQGSTTTTLTILNVSQADAGNYAAQVSNAVSETNSADSAFSSPLTVNNQPLGLLYNESFPYIGPASGVNVPVTTVGWVAAIPDSPNRLFQQTTTIGDATGFAFESGSATTVFYTDINHDTGFSGLPFPIIDPAFYPILTFSIDLAPSFAPTNVTAFIAVEEEGGNWFVSAAPLPVPTGTTSGTLATYTQTFDPHAANWKNLTVTATGATIGSLATSDLNAKIIGAGVVFVHTGSGTFNFDNFVINGTLNDGFTGAVGGLNVSSVTGNTVTISWPGNPIIKLQSSPSLNPPVWTDVTNSLGAHSLSVIATGSKQFFRLVNTAP